MDVLISLIVVIISQCIHIAKHQVVHLKYIQFLFVNYTSIKLFFKNFKLTLNYFVKMQFTQSGHSCLVPLPHTTAFTKLILHLPHWLTLLKVKSDMLTLRTLVRTLFTEEHRVLSIRAKGAVHLSTRKSFTSPKQLLIANYQ